MSKTKQEKWIKYRHRVVRNIVYAILYPYSRIVYGIKIEKFKEQRGRQYLVLYNHQTPFDQFFVGMAFKGPIYYLATEDLFSNGFISSVIRWLIAPIPIKKQTTDVKAVMTCLRVAREGGTIAIAPEGNRTYSGKTEYMNPAIASLAKKLGLPIALCRIEGGYGAEPRWSNNIRRGSVRCFVSRVIEPEEHSALTADELLSLIQKGLSVNDCEAGGKYKGAKRAEYLERLLYVCPECGLAGFESRKNEVFCKNCGLSAEYGENLRLNGTRFSTITEWYDYQKDFINSFNPTEYTESPLFIDNASVFSVVLNKKKVLLQEDAKILLFGDRVMLGETILPFDEIKAAAVLGRNKLNLYFNDEVYQLKGGKRFNAIKYVHIYNRYKNLKSGEKNEQFLGL